MEEKRELPENLQDLPPEVPREELIKTAVKFLQNPKVASSPLAQKRAFLVRKGLTQQEIDIAIHKSGASEAENARVEAQNRHLTNGTPTHTALVAAPIPASRWARFRDITSTIFVIGGVSYGVYTLVKSYIVPRLRGTQAKDRLDQLNDSVTDLQTNMVATLAKIQENLNAIQQVLERQEGATNNVLRSLRTTENLSEDGVRLGMSEVKAEVASLKGLLLSRRQFPPTPAQTPIIPSWQLAEKETVINETQPASDTGEVTPVESKPQPVTGKKPSADEASVMSEPTIVSDAQGDDGDMQPELNGSVGEVKVSPTAQNGENASQTDEIKMEDNMQEQMN